MNPTEHKTKHRDRVCYLTGPTAHSSPETKLPVTGVIWLSVSSLCVNASHHICIWNMKWEWKWQLCLRYQDHVQTMVDTSNSEYSINTFPAGVQSWYIKASQVGECRLLSCRSWQHIGQGCQTQIHRGPKLKTASKSRGGHIQYLLKFFLCKHELKFNIGLLNLGQAA